MPGLHLVDHPVAVVIEPPGGAELDLSGDRLFLKTAGCHRKAVVVVGVKAVQNGLWQAILPFHPIEEPENGFNRKVVPNSVEAGVCPRHFKHGGVDAAHNAKVELHGEPQLVIDAAQVKHYLGMVGADVVRSQRLSRKRFGKGGIRVFLVTGSEFRRAEGVVGKKAAVVFEKLRPL